MYKLQKRRAISSIIATLMLLAIVVAIGSVILFQGVGGINNFNISLMPFQSDQANANLESLVIENVHFYSNNQTMKISVKNTGTTSITIDSIKVTKIDTQELVVNNSTISKQIFPGYVVDLNQNAGLLLNGVGPSSATWSDLYYYNSNSAYKIAIVTVRGTGITTTITPYPNYNT